ncbi:MAG: hypothetical protein HY471_00310 [Candidatus Sungbacteria bacterium]|nr:hypothetical protein [Candidatus Sungbacteria bacterium]
MLTFSSFRFSGYRMRASHAVLLLLALLFLSTLLVTFWGAWIYYRYRLELQARPENAEVRFRELLVSEAESVGELLEARANRYGDTERIKQLAPLFR